jgi:CDP-diacylglycerol---serine O-phosphatidyltransferase
MNRLRITPSVIPNLFTAMNMFSGFFSIIKASQGDFYYAAWLIIVAAIFDALDGFMARLTKSSSELGVELDSLSDVVSFGAAPGFLIYQSFLFQYEAFGIVLSSLLLIAGGFRLARFNVQLVGFNKDYFKGLPIPASGITISAFLITYYDKISGFSSPYSDFIIPLVIALSYLMISTIKYDTFPKISKEGFKEKPFHIIFIFISIITLLITRGQALFYIFVFMILFGIFRHIFYRFSKKS